MNNIEQFKRHIAFDLDGTVLEETEWSELGKPIPENVAFIRALHKAGVPVAIYTARIYQDKSMEEKTAAYLEEIGVPYSELSCEKKPYYVLFVDDRAEKVEHNKPWSEKNKENILMMVERYKMNEFPIDAISMDIDVSKTYDSEVSKIEVMENTDSTVMAGKMKLSTFISQGQYEYVYFATGGQLMSLSKGQLTQPIIDEIVKKQPSVIWLIKNKMKKVSEFMSYWEQKQMEPQITYFGHPSDSMRRVVVFLKDGVLGEFFVISVYNKEQYIVKLSDLIKVNPNKFIIASLDEELDEKLNKDLTDEDIARILDKIKKKNLNINVLKLAWPEINTQKSDLLKKLREGKSNIV